ncbi:MAG: hypothetical protein ACTSPI_00730 [Candidatus Heimdallarchaeaceae archaeon]
MEFESIFIQAFIGFAGIPAVVGIVDLIKDIKDFGKYNRLVSLFFAMLFNIGGAVLFIGTDLKTIVSAAGVGLLVSLAANGYYDVNK